MGHQRGGKGILFQLLWIVTFNVKTENALKLVVLQQQQQPQVSKTKISPKAQRKYCQTIPKLVALIGTVQLYPSIHQQCQCFDKNNRSWY